jgi:uncharacterized membrane protein
MMYPGAYMTDAMGWWMVLWLVVSLAVVALFVVLLVRLLAPAATRTDASEARRILDARLARGEIDPQDYRDRLALLGDSGR